MGTALTTVTTTVLVAILTVLLTMAVGSHTGISPCEHEDGSRQATCYWDASERGNRIGQSFVSYDYGNKIVFVK